MQITIICVGQKHDADLKDAINKYASRIARFTKLNWQVLPSSDKPQESKTILSKLDSADQVILLDETGTIWDTPTLAAKIEQAAGASAKNLVFIIGGAYGVSDEVKSRASHIWSLSKLVFPHQLVRLILAEQIYRAYAIQNNLPYHHS